MLCNNSNESVIFLSFVSLLAQCKRLDGGLDKLKEASIQLVELNKKLAEQRIVLAEKSAACEALLKEISANTEVGRWFTNTEESHRLSKAYIVCVGSEDTLRAQTAFGDDPFVLSMLIWYLARRVGPVSYSDCHSFAHLITVFCTCLPLPRYRV